MRGLQQTNFESEGLRTVVATIDREISDLSRQATIEACRTATDELLSSWTRLVQLLKLSPAPELRECPVCKHSGMREATRCGYCWTKLPPLGG
jgi:hypothetical protein